MIQLIVGERGKGKTKNLLDMANAAVETANGSLVFLDKNQKLMYDLHRKVRLIDVSEYPIKDAHEFLGFLCGIISQDSDLEKMYLDSFLTIACMEENEVSYVLDKLEQFSKLYKIDFILSVSLSESELPDGVKDKVIISV
jgi:hypothetical protein